MVITPVVHLIRDSIVNAYLIIGDDGLALVDTGLRGNARSILRAIRKLGFTPADLHHIYITHCDGDHVGGVALLKSLSNATVYAHPIEALAMAIGSPSREINTASMSGRVFRMFDFVFRCNPAQTDVLLDQNETTELPGGMLALQTPGHTPGHISYLLPDKGVLFGGDSLSVEGGKIRASHGPATWDQKQADASARLQASLGAQMVCLGHGLVTERASTKFQL